MMQGRLFVFVIAGLAVLSCNNDNDVRTDLDSELLVLLENASPDNSADFFILPESDDLQSIPQDEKNALTSHKVNLGQMLFHETALAVAPKYGKGMGTYSCASCHHARAGFQAGRIQGIAEGGLGFGLHGEDREPDPAYDLDSLDVQPIRTPSAMNSAYQEVQLWNGQFGATGMNSGTEASWTPGTPKEVNNLGYEGVETQAIAGLTVHRMDLDSAIAIPGYKIYFDQVFPEFTDAERYTKECAGLAIAAYERTLLSNRAPFQRWLRGDVRAMDDKSKRGAILFFGEAGCVQCHTGPALNQMAFYALGMADLDGDGVYGSLDNDTKKGRGGFTGDMEDMYKFKVPQLYNLRDVGFYGHGGNFTTIRDVVEYKNAAIAEHPEVPASQLAAAFVPLGLTDTEVEEIAAFLEYGLYDPNLLRYEPGTLLSGLCFPNNDAQSKEDLGCE